MTARLFLLAVFTFVFIKGRCQTPVWAISGSFTSIAANYNGNLYTADDKTVTLYDTSAHLVWRKDYGAAIQNLATAPDHALYITGSFSERIQLGNYTLTPTDSHSVYVARLDDQGVVQWAKQLDRLSASTGFQLAVDSKSAVYVAWVEDFSFFFAKIGPDGNLRYTKSLVLGNKPYYNLYTTPVNTISVDKQDNLHVFYRSIYVSNPADPYSFNVQSRVWYDSTGFLMGSDRNLKETEREIFCGYKAGKGTDEFIYTKTRQTITGSGMTSLSGCISTQVPCYSAPPVNPDYDDFGNTYYAGHYYVVIGSLYCTDPLLILKFACSNAITRKPDDDHDLYILIRDSLVSTKDNGLTDEYAVALDADPKGRSLYILANWNPRGADTSKFYFGRSTLTNRGRMVLRYRVDRPSVLVQAGTDKVICPGGSTPIGSLEMARSGKAPYTYSWQPVVRLNDASAPNPTASPEHTTEYIVSVTDATGADGHDTIQVKVDSNLYRPMVSLISGVNPFCEGQTIVLKASDAVSYQWSNGATTQTVRITASNALTVTAVNAEGCIGTSAPFIATMNPGIPPPVLKQNGNTLRVEPAAALYQWYLNGLLIPEAAGPTLQIEKGGEYKVVVADKNGCSNTASLVTVKRITTPSIDYQVYPNPVTNDLHIVYSLKQPQAVVITLKDMLGHTVITVREREQQAAGEYHYSINKASFRLQKGYYFVEFRVSGKRIVQTVLVL